MELEAVILKRRSVRKFKAAPVSDEIIDKLLRMAQVAPSGGNGQDHVFGIVRDPDLKRELAKAAGNQMWIADAPVVIACCARLGAAWSSLPEDDFGLEVNKLRWGEDFWNYLLDHPDQRAVSCLLSDGTPLIPTEHIVLAAEDCGLSACYIGWLDVKKASELLKLPEDIRCLYLLPVGYADEEPKPIKRKSLGEISFRDTYKG